MLPDVKKLIKNVYTFCKREAKLKRPLIRFENATKRACALLDINKTRLWRTVQDDASVGCVDDSNGKKPPGRAESIDSFSKSVVKQACFEFFNKNKTLTLRNLQKYLKETHDLDVKKYVLWKALHSIGFKYGRVQQNKKGLFERKDIARKRIEYLRSIDRYRKDKRNIVYLDETWVDSNTYPQQQWFSGDINRQRKLPSSRGKRFVILHCGGFDGFIKNCDLVFESKANDGRDYHSEMNGNIFKTWVNDQLIPNLPPNSVAVMDNASYHSMQVEGTKAPTTSSKKGEIVDWLESVGVKTEQKMTKKQLYEIVKLRKEKHVKQFQIDQILHAHEHTVLRLPPYHCDLNPIELIWADVKRFVSENNTTFKKNDVRVLIGDAFSAIDQKKWMNACGHVESIERQYFRTDNVQFVPITPIIINIEDSSDDEDSSESDSDDESEVIDV